MDYEDMLQKILDAVSIDELEALFDEVDVYFSGNEKRLLDRMIFKSITSHPDY